MDPKTGDIYHIKFKPASDGIRSRLIQRKDDNESTIRNRLAAYHVQTAPLADWYDERGLLSRVDGTRSITDVGSDIASKLST